MSNIRGKIIEIKRFAVHDGDGIRTTVFLKGCPLKCLWCHNPEGISFAPQLAYYENKCISCGECLGSCPAGAHRMGENGHIFDRALCVGCGKCEENCLGEALKHYGKDMSVDELLPMLLEDKEFYENSGGGVTLSGGECLMQAEFCKELLKKLKENRVNTAVDTCGFVKREAIDAVMPYTDIFLYDIKAFDEDVHIKCTGVSNKLILENLKYIDSCGKDIEVRIPYVPDFNSDQIEKIAELLASLKNITKVRVLPYHNYAGSKYASLDMKNTLPEKLPSAEEVKNAERILSEKNISVF
ncbi:MAG: glycyl-radical enzyme activating protein [Clostridia bacterium]|nr:glycyl-radical enzyme activating protein [Clostridia bacterium]